MSQDYHPALPVRLEVHLQHRWTQDSTEDFTSSPATIRRRSTRSPVLGDQLRSSENQRMITGTMITGTSIQYWETCCAICQNGWRTSQQTLKTKECWHQGTHPQALLVNQIRNVLPKWYWGSTIFILSSRKTEIAKSAREPRLQGILAEIALVIQNLVQKISGDFITADHKVLGWGCESRINHRYSVVVPDLATQWIQSYPCKTKTSQETERTSRKFLQPSEKPRVFLYGQFVGIWQNLWRNFLESLQLNASPFRDFWYCWEWYAESRKELLQYCCNQVWTKNGGLNLWNCYLRYVQDLLSYVKTPYAGRFGEPSKGPVIKFVST